MANRTRPIRIEFCVSENEHQIIKSKMAQLGTKNMGAYLRKMAIDGYIIKGTTLSRRSSLPLSAVLRQISIRFAAASTQREISTRMMSLS